MKAIGKDGRWHDWDNLSAEEQKDWMDAMTIADNIHERQKKNKTQNIHLLKHNIMNKQDRKMIEGYISSLRDIMQNVEDMLDEEQEKLDNMPEGLQESERGMAIQNAIDNLDSASDPIGDAIDYLNEAME